MKPFSLCVHGWREINHSYALVNQYQLLELAKHPQITLYHEDLPLFDPKWSAARNSAGLDAERRLRIASIPAPGGESPDVIYRIGFPFRLYGANAGKLVVFMTSENYKFYPQDIYSGPEASGA